MFGIGKTLKVHKWYKGPPAFYRALLYLSEITKRVDDKKEEAEEYIKDTKKKISKVVEDAGQTIKNIPLNF